jgi:hypothetical protein
MHQSYQQTEQPKIPQRPRAGVEKLALTFGGIMLDAHNVNPQSCRHLPLATPYFINEALKSWLPLNSVLPDLRIPRRSKQRSSRKHQKYEARNQ